MRNLWEKRLSYWMPLENMETWIFNYGNSNGTNILKRMTQTLRPMCNKRAPEIPNGAAWDSIAHICYHLKKQGCSILGMILFLTILLIILISTPVGMVLVSQLHKENLNSNVINNKCNVINLPKLTYLVTDPGFTSKSFGDLTKRFSLEHFSAAGIVGRKASCPFLKSWCYSALQSWKIICP